MVMGMIEFLLQLGRGSDAQELEIYSRLFAATEGNVNY